MSRFVIGAALAAGAMASTAMVAGCATMSQGGSMAGHVDCSRAGLQAAVDSYIAAQGAGDASLMPLADALRYEEQMVPADIATGVLTSPLDIDYHHSLLDTELCETFTEAVVTDPSHPYVLGVHMGVGDGAITSISTLVTDDDDWLFSAQRFHDGIIVENWNPIPEESWDSRETLIAAADSYFNLFGDKSIEVPWFEPCYRQEGGLRTGGTCDVGVPDGVEFPIRHHVVDQSIGAVVGLVRFGGPEGLPDSHLFRVVDGRITNVHTITVCDEFNCGFDLPESLADERAARGGAE